MMQNTSYILTRDLTVRGLVNKLKDNTEFYEVVTPLVQSGKIKYKETRTTGLEHAVCDAASLV